MNFYFILLMILLEILAGVTSSKEQFFLLKLSLFTFRYLGEIVIIN